VADSNKPALAISANKTVWKNVRPRAISAVLFAAVCIPPMYMGGYFWALFVLVLGLRLVLEWVRMSDPNGDWLAMAIPMLGLTVAIGYVAEGHNELSLLTLVVTAVTAGLERMRRGGALWSGLGTLYVAVPTILMVAIRGPLVGFSDGLQLMLFILLIVIGADVGAYFGGSAMKGPKIAPKISPNKTWSGFFSGLVLGCIIGVITGQLMGLSVGSTLLFAIPIIVFSVVGDFLESALKRHFNVKDTGNLIPGHGGLLDRVDGLMLAIAVSAVVLWAVPSLFPGVL